MYAFGSGGIFTIKKQTNKLSSSSGRVVNSESTTVHLSWWYYGPRGPLADRSAFAVITLTIRGQHTHIFVHNGGTLSLSARPLIYLLTCSFVCRLDRFSSNKIISRNSSKWFVSFYRYQFESFCTKLFNVFNCTFSNLVHCSNYFQFPHFFLNVERKYRQPNKHIV